MQRNKDISFGSQMKLDLHAVETIVNKLFDDIRDSNKEKLADNITIKRRFEEKAITILQIRRRNHEHTSELKKLLAPVLYSIIKDAETQVDLVKTYTDSSINTDGIFVFASQNDCFYFFFKY